MNYYKQIIILIFFLPINNIAQEGHEQIAFNFFLEQVFSEKYVSEKSIFVSKKIEQETNISLYGLFRECDLISKEFINFNYEKNNIQEIELPLNSKIRFLKKHRKHKLDLVVHKSIYVEDIYYVYLSIGKDDYFIDHFLIKIINNQVIDYCFLNEVI